MNISPVKNCYYYSLTKAAFLLGINPLTCFLGLWSETEFSYDSKNGVYNTIKLIDNLECHGIKINVLDSSTHKERENSILSLKPGEFAALGIDCFYLHWHHYYNALHSIHYFLAQQTSDLNLCCFDPMYDKEYITLSYSVIISHGLDIRQLQQIKPRP